MKRVLYTYIKKIVVIGLVLLILIGAVNFNSLKVLVYPFFRGIQQELILYKVKAFHTFETEHFMIKYEKEDEDIINLVAEAAEKDYSSVCDMFDYYPKDKTAIIVYNDPQELMNNANLGQGKPPMGVYYASTIQVLSPKIWASQEEMKEVFMNEGPMVHELTHLLVDDVTNGNYPLWFTEGLALYQEYVQTGYEWGADFYFQEEPYTVDELTEEFHQLDEILAYKRSFEIVKNLIEKDGFDDINRMLKELGKGKNLKIR